MSTHTSVLVQRFWHRASPELRECAEIHGPHNEFSLCPEKDCQVLVYNNRRTAYQEPLQEW